MKNIHLIPTDKPSRLYKTGNFLLLDSRAMPNNTLETKNQNIYITNDEEIKEGNWLLIIDDFETYVHEHKGDNLPTTYYKKIILTTDVELIKDGVQAIDDEFLQWFVKNPSCEEVYITNDYEQVNQDNPITRGSTNEFHKYKIIIPSEPKQELTI